MLLADTGPPLVPASPVEAFATDGVGLVDVGLSEAQAVAESERQIFSVTFNRAGSLGIEFERQDAPYVIEKIHDGAASGMGLEPGDTLHDVGGQVCGDLNWENFVALLKPRPVTATFVRDPARTKGGGASALFSGFGFAGKVKSLGDSVTQQGISLGGIGGQVSESFAGRVGGFGLGGLWSRQAESTASPPAPAEAASAPAPAQATSTPEPTSAQAAVLASAVVAEGVGGNLGTSASGGGDGIGGAVGAGYAAEAVSLESSSGGGDVAEVTSGEAAVAEVGATPTQGSVFAAAKMWEQRAKPQTVATASVGSSSTTGAYVAPVAVGSEKSVASSGGTAADATNSVGDSPVLAGTDVSVADVAGVVVGDGDADNAVASRGTTSAVVAHVDKGSPAAKDVANGDGVGSFQPTDAATTVGQLAPAAALPTSPAVEPATAPTSAALATAVPSASSSSAAAAAVSPTTAPLPELAPSPPTAVTSPPGAVAVADAAVQVAQAEALRRTQEEAKWHAAEASRHAADAKAQGEAVARVTAELERVKAESRSRLEGLTSELQEGQASIDGLQSELREREGTMQLAEGQLRSATEDSKRFSEELQERSAHLARLEAELRAAQADAASKAEQVEALGLAATVRDAERLKAANEATSRLASVESQVQAATERHAKEALEAQRHAEQLRFALGDRERQLSESIASIAQKDVEVKDLLRQLAAAGSGAQAASNTSAETNASDASTSFEVLFALEGPLGLEFQQQEPPYVVAQVHDRGVAAPLGIQPHDELVQAGQVDVTSSPWPELVKRLGTRPVVVKFVRNPERQKAQQEDSFIFSSVSSVLKTAKSVVPIQAAASAPAEPQDGRLQAEAERLSTLLRARDQEVVELLGKLQQRDAALAVFEGAGEAGGAAEMAKLAQDRAALSQQVEQLDARVAEAERRAHALQGEREAATERCAEEARQKEEYRSQANALNDQMSSLMRQFQELQNTCQSLSLDMQQKAHLESQVQDLVRMNKDWQQAHHSLNTESESLRQQSSELHQLRSEVAQLRRFQTGYSALEERLHEADGHLEATRTEVGGLRDARLVDQSTIQRLQTLIESMEESGESQAGHLESELMERSRENSVLRREVDEQRRRAEELLSTQRGMLEAAEEGRTLKAEVEKLRRDFATVEEEKRSLSGVVDRCVEKLEKDSRERPHLVDKRMVTQMLAAYLEQRDNHREAHEILSRMADLLGFTMSEREQVGLSQQRRTLQKQMEDPAGLTDLTDRFVDFLLEESEA